MSKRFALACLLVACGARTELGGAHHDVDAGAGTCSAPPAAPPRPCSAWQAGSPQTLEPSGAGSVAGAIAGECGVLVTWYTATFTSIAWTTRLVDFNGAPLAAPKAHPSLAAQTSASAVISLAYDGSRIGALEDDETGCHFLTMGSDGSEVGAPLALGTSPCLALASQGGRWTFLRDTNAETPVSLVTLQGSSTSESMLSTPGPQVIWDRLVFPDGSFLLDTFFEDASGQYTNWLGPFDASGAALGPQIPVAGYDSAPVQLVRAGNAAMAAWWWSSIRTLPVDELGHATGPAQTVSTDSPVYEMSLFAAPDGDVLVTWILLEPNGDMSLHARALATDGTPRGPATLLAPQVSSAVVRGAIESTGARALLAVTARDGSIEALPLTCAQ